MNMETGIYVRGRLENLQSFLQILYGLKHSCSYIGCLLELPASLLEEKHRANCPLHVINIMIQI